MAGMRLVTVALALLVALAPRSGVAQTPRAAPAPLVDLFPADTVAYVEIQLRTGDGKGAPLDRLLANLLGQPALAAHAGPWGMLPQLARAAALGVAAEDDEVRVVAALAADDPALLLGLLQRAELPARPVEPYAGLPVYAVEGEHSFFLAATSAYLLAANDRDALAAALDRALAGASAPPGLAANPRYRAAISRLPANRIVTGYVDGENLVAWLEAGGPRPTRAVLPRETPPLLPGVPGAEQGLRGPAEPAQQTAVQTALGAFESGGLALAVQAVPEGLRTVLVVPSVGESETPPSTSAALGRVPADALVAAAGRGIGPRLEEALAQSELPLDELLPPDFDLNADLLDWLDGEYGVALLAPDAASPALGGFPLPTVALLFEVRDPAQVDASLRHLAALAEQAGWLPDGTPREEQEAGVAVRRLPLFEGLELTWGALGSWVFVTTGAAAPLAEAAAAGGLAATPTYARLVRSLPTPNSGVFYVQVGDTLRWVDSLEEGPLAEVPADERWWRPLAARLGALVMATGLPRGGWLEQVSVLQVLSAGY